MEEILNQWREDRFHNKKGEGKVSEKVWQRCLLVLENWMKFKQSNIDNPRTFTMESLDELIDHERSRTEDEIAKDIKKFIQWMQGIEVHGFSKRQLTKPREKYLVANSAVNNHYPVIRSFFRAFKIDIGTISFKKPKSKTRDNDENHIVYHVGETEDDESYMDYKEFKMVLDRLNHRDRTVMLCLLSSGQDIGDILPLMTIGWARTKSNTGAERFFLQGERAKTGVSFKTFISKEATQMVKTYIETDRKGAKPDEPIFMARANAPLIERHIQQTLLSVVEDLGWKNGSQHPYRTKRMRHIFADACDAAGISIKTAKIMQGRVLNTHEDYGRRPNKSYIERDYKKVEPYITVYGESIEVVAELSKMEKKYTNLEEALMNQIKSLKKELAEVKEMKLMTDEMLNEAIDARIRLMFTSDPDDRPDISEILPPLDKTADALSVKDLFGEPKKDKDES